MFHDAKEIYNIRRYCLRSICLHPFHLTEDPCMVAAVTTFLIILIFVDPIHDCNFIIFLVKFIIDFLIKYMIVSKTDRKRIISKRNFN